MWDVIYVRWKPKCPPPGYGGGYQVWDGDRWLDITMAEYQSYLGRGRAIHHNPAWAV